MTTKKTGSKASKAADVKKKTTVQRSDKKRLEIAEDATKDVKGGRYPDFYPNTPN